MDRVSKREGINNRFFSNLLEHLQAKWAPVRVKKMRQC